MIHTKFALTMLGTDDLERAVAFYTDVLGLSVSSRFGEFVFFDTGATTFAITGELAATQTGPATHEIVFGVGSVEQAYAELKDRIAFANEPRPVDGKNWAVNFRDPDGHQCSFYGPQ
jgi:catechol 2,3-dioxygenase-like lactoylglutathione lyase family enzyme